MKKLFPFILFVLVLFAVSVACGGPDLVCPNGPQSCYNPELGGDTSNPVDAAVNDVQQGISSVQQGAQQVQSACSGDLVDTVLNCLPAIDQALPND